MTQKAPRTVSQSRRRIQDGTVREHLRAARRRLTQAGIAKAALDADVLMAHVLKRSREWLWAHDDHALTAAQARRFRQLLAQRSRRVPVAYLTGVKEFFGEPIRVDRSVLVPRPDTETLVEAGLRFLQDHPGARDVIDLGTGSGAIAIAVSRNCPRARVLALDNDERALQVARANVRARQLSGRVKVRRSDLFQRARPADLVLANLPYLSAVELRRLPLDVRHEPKRALNGGADGLRLIRRALADAPRMLRPGGAMVVECDPRQARSVASLARSSFPEGTIGVLADLSRRSRAVEVRL
jgi:release factor glutamine methyltransferase